MTRDERAEKKSLILYAIWMTVLVAVGLWLAYLIREVLLLLYASLILAIGFSPVVRLIERQRLLPVGTTRFPRWLAILVLYVFIISAAASVISMILPPLTEQAREFWAHKDQMFESVQAFLVERGLMERRITLEQAVAQTPVSGDTVGTVFGAVRGVIGGLFGLMTILIVTFYLLIDSWSIHQTFLRFFPERYRARVDAATRDITMKVSAWLAGQLFLGIIIGSTSAIALWLIGVPFFYVLALISAIGELIPIIGPILAAVPAVLVAGTVSYEKALIVIVFFIVQQQIENHVLVPKVMERQVGVSAVIVIVSVLIGGKLLGVAGVLLAVPSAAILQVLFMEIGENGGTGGTETGGTGGDGGIPPPGSVLLQVLRTCNSRTAAPGAQIARFRSSSRLRNVRLSSNPRERGNLPVAAPTRGSRHRACGVRRRGWRSTVLCAGNASRPERPPMAYRTRHASSRLRVDPPPSF